MRTQAKYHSTKNKLERTDSTWIPRNNKTIHHEITQLTSTQEYGFYTNPNDATRPNVMNSLHRPQSESVDSTRILISTKSKPRSKRNQQQVSNHSTGHKVGSTGATRIPMQHKYAKVVWLISKRIIQVHDPHCAKKTREIQGDTENKVKTPNFGKLSKLKPIWPLGLKTPKNPKINRIGHRMQKRLA